MLKVYTAPGCPYCREIVEYLTLHNYKFTEIDVSKDKDAAMYLLNLEIKGVPVTEGDDWRIIGYDIHQLKKELENVLNEKEKDTIQARLRKKGFM